MKKLVLSTALLVLGVATLATPAKAAKKATKFSLTLSTTAVTRKRNLLVHRTMAGIRFG